MLFNMIQTINKGVMGAAGVGAGAKDWAGTSAFQSL